MASDPQRANADDPALTALSRELYWAQERAARARMGTAELRDRMHETALRLRKDETLIIPLGEGTLASPSRWRRQLKYRLFRLMRPISWRYDRLLADQAELMIGLAEQLMAAEAEIARLRARLGETPVPASPPADGATRP
jgi:hypothetical protein